MLETPHVILGAAIATKIPNPLISVPLAFASHFALDMVPHWNPHLNTELKKHGKVTKRTKWIVVFDVGLALVSGSLIAAQALPDSYHASTILMACLASVLPDVIEGPYFFLNMKSRFVKSWITFQKAIQADTTVIPGLATQVVTVVASVVWIFN